MPPRKKVIRTKPPIKAKPVKKVVGKRSPKKAASEVERQAGPGRPKGAVSKRTERAYDLVMARGACPVEALISMSDGTAKCNDCSSGRVTREVSRIITRTTTWLLEGETMNDKVICPSCLGTQYLRFRPMERMEIEKLLMPHIYPKLKSAEIDLVTNDGRKRVIRLASETDLQKLLDKVAEMKAVEQEHQHDFSDDEVVSDQ